METTEQTQKRKSGIGFPTPSELVGILKKRALLITSLTLILGSAAVGLAYVIPPKFESTASVLIDARDHKIVDFDAVVSNIQPDTPTIESEVEVIQSSAVLGRVADDLKLNEDSEFLHDDTMFGRFLKKLGLIKDRFAEENTNDANVDPIEASAGSAPASSDVIDALASRLTVARLRATYVITITFRSSSPGKAAIVANAIANAYLQDQVDSKMKATELANNWLDKRIISLRERVHEAERAVETYKADKKLVDSEGHLLTEKELARVQEQLVISQAATANARSRYKQLENLPKDSDAIATIADVLQNPTVTRLKEQYANTTRLSADLETHYGPLHPSLAKAKAEVADARRQLDLEVARIASNIKTEYEISAGRESALAKQLDDLKSTTGAANQSVVRLRELEREAAASRTVYEGFLKRFEETSQQNLQLADARVVQIAEPNFTPASPKRKQIMIMGFAIGLILGIAIAVLLEMLYPSIIKPERIEGAVQLPHLATMPAIAGWRGDADGRAAENLRLIMSDPNSAFAEAIRQLRVNLDSSAEPGAQVILVLSTLPNEGRTMIASNLAHNYAMAGIKTLLIDGDLRMSGLTRQFLPGAESGLFEALHDGEPLRNAVVREQTSGLHFLPAAAEDSRPRLASEVLASRGLADGFRALRGEFEIIVVDSPPVLPVVDARILAEQADQLVFVYRWMTTPKALARRAVKVLGYNAPKIAGVVANGIDPDKIPSNNDVAFPSRRFIRRAA